MRDATELGLLEALSGVVSVEVHPSRHQRGVSFLTILLDYLQMPD